MNVLGYTLTYDFPTPLFQSQKEITWENEAELVYLIFLAECFCSASLNASLRTLHFMLPLGLLPTLSWVGSC